MKPEEINRAIAEAIGITSHDNHGPMYHTKDGYVRDCPNYHGSLDACAEFERGMEHSIRDRVEYVEKLGEVLTGQTCRAVPTYWLLLCTPPQRCEALLRVKGLWK